MTYGAAKRRDIARSVLPSTHRTGARKELAGIKRGARRTLRTELRALRATPGAGAVADAFDDAPFDPLGYPDEAIDEAVWDRRLGDKLAPLFRWARATTAQLPVEDRLPAVRRVFADDLPGRHAIGHLELDRHFLVAHPHNRFWLERWCGPPARPTPPFRSIAEAALVTGRHAELNRRMKRHPANNGAVRLLAGAHDLDQFAADCAAERVWTAALDEFETASPS